MTREETIAHLELHGYRPYMNVHGWAAIWSDEQGKGRMAKFFVDTEDGPAWDVRNIISNLAMMHDKEAQWEDVPADTLAWFVADELPPKCRHRIPYPTPSDPLGQRGYEGEY